MANVLQTVNLTMRFRSTTVLDRVSIAVPEGKICGLVGVNGAGKTTTIKILMNILRPTSGRAEVLGRDSRQLSPEHLTHIGYVSENQELPGTMTVSAFLTYLKPFYPTWDDELAGRLLRDFELPPDRKIRHLSHGMRMKTALVSAIAYRPQLLILDEPFTGLDPLVRSELIDGVLANTNGATVLVSSHDLTELETFATHIAYLDTGRLLLSEDLASLTTRFREVEVEGQSISLVQPLPSAWINLEYLSCGVRFVDSDFERDRTDDQIRRVFGTPLRVQTRPMNLLAIFLALARAARKKS